MHDTGRHSLIGWFVNQAGIAHDTKLEISSKAQHDVEIIKIYTTYCVFIQSTLD